MTKLVLAAVAALSILATPVLAGPAQDGGSLPVSLSLRKAWGALE